MNSRQRELHVLGCSLSAIVLGTRIKIQLTQRKCGFYPRLLQLLGVFSPCYVDLLRPQLVLGTEGNSVDQNDTKQWFYKFTSAKSVDFEEIKTLCSKYCTSAHHIVQILSVVEQDSDDNAFSERVLLA